jgi:hypothetical protein
MARSKTKNKIMRHRRKVKNKRRRERKKQAAQQAR